MNSGYAGENSSLLPQAAGSIDAVRGGGIIGGGDPKEINLFGTKITITDPSAGALTSEHEKILSKLNFKDKDDAEKRNILQSIYNEGCDTNAALDLKSGCSPMRGLVTALAMKLLENMSTSAATATTVGDDEGIVISMTIPIEKLNIALGSMATNDIPGNPDTWCVAGDDVREGMDRLLVEPLKSLQGVLDKLKGGMQDNINKSIIYDSDILDARFNRIIGGIDMLLADVTKIQGKTCDVGGNAESTVSSTTWISRGPMGEEGDVATPANVADVNVSNLPSNEEIERHIEEGGEETSTEAALEGYEEGEEPPAVVSPEEQARINASTKPTTLRVTSYPATKPNSASSTPTRSNLSAISEENNKNNNTSSSTSNVNSTAASGTSSEVPSTASSSVTEGGGMYRKKRILPNKTRRKVRFGDTPIIKLI